MKQTRSCDRCGQTFVIHEPEKLPPWDNGTECNRCIANDVHGLLDRGLTFLTKIKGDKE